ncbi:MAG: hypothetical protein CME26_17440 [Gemmatimonadetes bacterium]|nr:hypothetical protein [Gemmatimonadota bacterium]
MRISKVVVPVAGMGTRLFPTTRALPKEMLPVGRHPTIQVVVDELVGAGLIDLLFITAPSKKIIERQFIDNLDAGTGAGPALTYSFAEQQTPPGWKKPGGTGVAIAMAEAFVDGDPFVVAYGDTIIRSTHEPSFLHRMLDAHSREDADATIAVRAVSENQIPAYGIVEPATGQDPQSDAFWISDIVEKPTIEEAPSNLAVNARYIFGPSIFPHIHRLGPVNDAEVGITNAIRTLIEAGGKVQCVPLAQGETRYDIGNHIGYFKAFIDYALADPDCGDEVRSYLSTVCAGGDE